MQIRARSLKGQFTQRFSFCLNVSVLQLFQIYLSILLRLNSKNNSLNNEGNRLPLTTNFHDILVCFLMYSLCLITYCIYIKNTPLMHEKFNIKHTAYSIYNCGSKLVYYSLWIDCLCVHPRCVTETHYLKLHLFFFFHKRNKVLSRTDFLIPFFRAQRCTPHISYLIPHIYIYSSKPAFSFWTRHSLLCVSTCSAHQKSKGAGKKGISLLWL